MRGKAYEIDVMAKSIQDHPRLCGEKQLHKLFKLHILGSPPPMRGKVGYVNLEFCSKGITPAYAGKRSRSVGTKSISKDHPRLCGEKIADVRGARAISGSPPPMRGKVHAFACFFPLCMDHPRLCGEKLVYTQPEHLSRGSPPPMRGKVDQLHSLLKEPWITPAYAGKRQCSTNSGFCIWDHPRLCGEKLPRTAHL